MRAMVYDSANSYSTGIRPPVVTITNLRKCFGADVIYDNFNYEFKPGTFTAIFGPNGCGKSTLINMMAGLTPYDAGQILYNGKDVSKTTIGYVFQNYREALFPWWKARENIEYPLKIKGMKAAERRRRVDELIVQFDIKFDLERYPYEFSGGQQQLLSILRALAPRPEIIFLDEPFSALDYEMTLFIREKLQLIFAQSKIAMVLVSHDLEDAVFLAEQVMMLSKRPTRLVEMIPVNLPYPRNDLTLLHPDFIEAKRHSLEIFQQEVRRP
ncbi:ABC transporter ATP-binding protein [Sodalis sp. RH22]|uniref:ABC transporter ATP-binding protein n=1 Tax=unclassified Sodalis (in: enterobacteria) TaxID=2636512 RepID=UPI0039B51E4E